MDASVAITAVAGISSAGGYITYRIMTAPVFDCMWCDKRKCQIAFTRCAPCQVEVNRLMLEEAEKGVVVEDPLPEMRRRFYSAR